MSEMRVVSVEIGFDSLLLGYMTILWQRLRFRCDDGTKYRLQKLYKRSPYVTGKY